MSPEDLQALINRAHAEGWQELDLSGMGLTDLPPVLDKPAHTAPTIRPGPSIPSRRPGRGHEREHLGLEGLDAHALSIAIRLKP